MNFQLMGACLVLWFIKMLSIERPFIAILIQYFGWLNYKGEKSVRSCYIGVELVYEHLCPI